MKHLLLNLITAIAFVPAAFAQQAPGYDLGKIKGYQDGYGGLSRTPARHEAEYSEADRKEFFRGYESGYNAGIKPGAPAPQGKGKTKPEKSGQPYFGEPLSSVSGQGTVTILEGQRKVAVCKTTAPNIEQTKFIEEQNKIVVKSRGNHGPATVQLFDTRTGRELGTVKAFELGNGGPAWAAGMAD